MVRPARRRHPRHNRLEDVTDADARLPAGQDHFLGGNGENILQLARTELEVGAGQVDFVDHRDDLELLRKRQVRVGHGLGFDALRRVHQQKRALAGRQRPGNFIGKVHVARRIHQIELVGFAVLGWIAHGHRVHLDRDATLLLEIHRVQHLVLHLPLRDGMGGLEQPVGQRRLAVVDVGDDAEIAFERYVHAE